MNIIAHTARVALNTTFLLTPWLRYLLLGLAFAWLTGCTGGPKPLVTQQTAPLIVTNAAGQPVTVQVPVYEVSSNVTAWAQAAQQIGQTVSAVAPPAAPVVTLFNGVLALAVAGVGYYAKLKSDLAKARADEAAAKSIEADAALEAGDRAIANLIGQIEGRLRLETDPARKLELNSHLAALEKERGKLAR